MKKSYIFIGLIIITVAALVVIPKINEANDKSNFRLAPTAYVSVVNDGFMYNKLFGGISDLKITVVNRSRFALDNVRVLVSYIRKNGQTYKEEFVDVNYIPANGQITVNAPDSDAGVDVNCRVYSVNSSEAGVN